MRTLKSSLLLLILLVVSVSVQSADEVYTKAMIKTIAQIDTAGTIGSIKKARNQFDRISQTYPNQWLPVYFLAYSDLSMIYMNPKASDNQNILTEAKELLNRLEKMKEVNKSELSNLWGYYYNALIVTDPASNGSKFYNEVIVSYKKAIELDAYNPRPVFLLAFFEQNLPSFLQSGNDFCNELKKSEELYNSELNLKKEIHWGKSFLAMLLSKCQ